MRSQEPVSLLVVDGDIEAVSVIDGAADGAAPGREGGVVSVGRSATAQGRGVDGRRECFCKRARKGLAGGEGSGDKPRVYSQMRSLSLVQSSSSSLRPWSLTAHSLPALSHLLLSPARVQVWQALRV